MGRVLTAVLALHWMTVFGIAAAHAVGLSASFRIDGRVASLHPVPGWEAAGQAGIAIGSAAVAALFLWVAVSALAEGTSISGTEEVTRLAFGAAIAITTLSLLTGLPGIYGNHAASSAVPLIALLCSYLVVRADRNISQPPGIASPDMKEPARLMALSAAHSSLLPRLGKTLVPANDRGNG